MIMAMCFIHFRYIVKSPEGKSNIGRSWLAIKLMVLPRLIKPFSVKRDRLRSLSIGSNPSCGMLHFGFKTTYRLASR